MSKKQFLITQPQQIALKYIEDNQTSEILLHGSAGSAKSIIAQFSVLKWCLKYKARIGIVRKNITQSMNTVVKSLEEVMDLQGIPREVMSFDRNNNTFTFDNGAEIILLNGDYSPQDQLDKCSRFGSYQLSMVVIDEANQIASQIYEVLNTRLRYITDEMRESDLIPKMIAITNPDANSFLYTKFIVPMENGTLPDHMAQVHSTLEDNPFLDESYKKKMRALTGTERDRLYLGKWVNQTDDVLVTSQQLDKLFKNYLRDTDYYATHISADIASDGLDASVICIWNELELVEIVRTEKTKLNETGALIKSIAKKYGVQNRNIVVDGDGVGLGIAHYENYKYFKNNQRALNNENFANIKSQMAFKFAELIEQISITAKIDSATQTMIRQELGAITKIIVNHNPLKINKKDDVKKMIGRSPDYSDAIIYRMYFELARTGTGIYNIY